MRAIIFANGILTLPLWGDSTPRAGDLVIAADGGSRHALQLGIIPDVVIGDFDSLEPEELARLQESGSRLIEFPKRKDFTDLELALEYALTEGVSDALVIGALGNRWDQTLANLLLPATQSLQDLKIRLVDGSQEISLARVGQTLELAGEIGDTVSLIPLDGDAEGIHTAGLEYALKGEILKFGASRGVSNVMVAEKAAVSLEKGILLCVIIHQMKKGELEV